MSSHIPSDRILNELKDTFDEKGVTNIKITLNHKTENIYQPNNKGRFLALGSDNTGNLCFPVCFTPYDQYCSQQ